MFYIYCVLIFYNSGDKRRPITIINNRPDTALLYKTIKEAYLTDIAIPNSHNLHSAITKKFQKYTDMKKELISLWKLKMAHTVPLVLSTADIITNKLHEILKLLNFHPALYILTAGIAQSV